jgi:nucleotide-binding universal stress UspA family protein
MSNDAANSTPAGRIVVGVDGSPASVLALRWAAGQAAVTGAELDAVMAWMPPSDYALGAGYSDDVGWEEDTAAVLEKTIEEALTGDAAEKVERRVVRGHPAQVLLDASADADLLVVGSRGHGGFTGMLLGSVSQHLVAHAPCPVLVVRDQKR